MVGFQKMRFTSCRIYTVFGKNVFWINLSFIEYLHSSCKSPEKTRMELKNSVIVNKLIRFLFDFYCFICTIHFVYNIYVAKM